GPALFPLVPKIGGLLKCLIVVDSKHVPAYRKISRPVVAHCCVPLKAVNVNARCAKGNTIQFRFLPGNRESNRGVQNCTEVKSVIRVLPEVIALKLDKPAKRLLDTGVELVPAAGLYGRLSLRSKRTDEEGRSRSRRNK